MGLFRSGRCHRWIVLAIPERTAPGHLWRPWFRGAWCGCHLMPVCRSSAGPTVPGRPSEGHLVVPGRGAQGIALIDGFMWSLSRSEGRGAASAQAGQDLGDTAPRRRVLSLVTN